MSLFPSLQQIIAPQQQRPQPVQQQQTNWLPLMSQMRNAESQYELEQQRQQGQQQRQPQNPLHYGPIGLAEGGPVQAGGQQGLTFEEATTPRGLSFEEAHGAPQTVGKQPSTMDLIK